MNQLIIARERETIGKMTDKNENTGMILLQQLLLQLLLFYGGHYYYYYE